LSENSDQLSQWRGYCPPGSGFSIGFDSQEIEDIAAQNAFNLSPCIYERGRQKEILSSLLDNFLNKTLSLKAFENFESFDERELDERKIIIINFLFDDFMPLAPTFKHNSFHEEREWRIISYLVPTEDSRCSVREGKSMLIPYLKVKLADDNNNIPIREIVVGPTPHKDLALLAAKLFNVSKKHLAPEIRSSDVPYRSW
jgi:hypothetical protein